MGAIVRLYHGENHYNFPRIWKWGVRISAALLVISVLSLFTRGLNLGIDFEGGNSYLLKAPGVTVEDARAKVAPLGLADAKIQTVGQDQLRVQAAAATNAEQLQIRQALADLAQIDPSQINTSVVGPTWGGEVTTSAVRALVVFLICILGYVTLTFRGEYKMALGVVIAVIHDVVISVGVYSVFQFEVTPATVIAFLTILGYSIYDTVVVYDKVQENAGRVGMSSGMTYTDMMSLSMNQVLVRSINTSLVAVLPVLSTLLVGALILGAVTLEEFSIALTVGLVIGAYSSIFVAAPVVAWMKEREPRNRQLREKLGRDVVRAGAPTAGQAIEPASSGGPSTEIATGGGTATATRPTARPVGERPAMSRNHPPRPRKQGKKR